ncbi:MAG TPA: TlpA disulfide reductase family protein [Casimicrobiaceae bacterium]|nr:TlpA disulfide reductase family protein [Casimicrobiaceae bacterium]
MRIKALLTVFALSVVVTTSACALTLGDAAPPLVLPTASGETVELAKLRGKVVYVDFWASWCGPCRRSFPWMNAMLSTYREQGLEIVAVNVDKKREDAEKFLSVSPARFTIVYDHSGSTPAAWQVKAMPTSYLVDSKGTIVLVEGGFRDERKAEIEARIRAALGIGRS